MKLGIVLFNLGGPDSLEAVEPFLRNLFCDPAIISLPGILRKPLARRIAGKRAPLARAIYSHMGGRSPILEQTQIQARALEMALKRRCPGAGLLHHSDQGCTYASEDYQLILDAHGITCSMSRRGDCYDNAVMESFFSTLKSELTERFDSFGEAKMALFDCKTMGLFPTTMEGPATIAASSSPKGATTMLRPATAADDAGAHRISGAMPSSARCNTTHRPTT